MKIGIYYILMSYIYGLWKGVNKGTNDSFLLLATFLSQVGRAPFVKSQNPNELIGMNENSRKDKKIEINNNFKKGAEW